VQKIQFHGLPAHLAFQLGDPLLVSPAFAVARESFRAEIAQLLFPAVQNVCVDFTGAGYLR